MKPIIRSLDRTKEILLFSIVLLMPFSYNQLNYRWVILFAIIVSILTFLILSKKIRIFTINDWSCITAVIFMCIFSFAEKVNFIQQFEIPVDISKRISFSTIILILTIVVYFIKALLMNEINIPFNSFSKSFGITSFIVILMVLIFYTVLKIYYHYEGDSGIFLLNKIIKYLVILFLVTDYLKDNKKIVLLNSGFVISLFIVIILRVVI